MARFIGPCLKFMNDFTATLLLSSSTPSLYRRLSQKVEREIGTQRVAHIFDDAHVLKRERGHEEGGGGIRETGGGRGKEGCAPRNILIVEFSVRAAYPLDPLCPLPATDLLIINYPDSELHPPSHLPAAPAST